MKTLSHTLILSLLFPLLTLAVRAQDIDSVPPVVTKTSPEAGRKDVPPGIVDIRISFSKPMAENSWIAVQAWKDSLPDLLGEPKLEDDHRTWVLKAKLQPNTTYGFRISSDRINGFKDENGGFVMPYVWVFRTTGYTVRR